MKKLITPFLKALLFLITVVILFTTCSCSREPVKWSNTTVYFEIEDLETIYVVKGRANFKEAQPTENGEQYKVEFSGNQESYTIRVTTFSDEIDYPHFSGFDAIDDFHEQNWQRDGNTFTLESENLQPPNGGYYTLFLSEDLVP